jgi:spore maturation protein CgeB
MKAQRLLWRLREWERRFYLAYLSKYFSLGVFGGDWSAMHLGPGGWVDFRQQSAAYARGRVALNITDGHDEEGVTLKPFEIAASGVPLLQYHARGLSELYTDGAEIAVFSTPREAREKLAALLASRERRIAMAAAARARTLAQHTWDRRIERMFELARLPLNAFQVQPPAAAAPTQSQSAA